MSLISCSSNKAHRVSARLALEFPESSLQHLIDVFHEFDDKID
jgi:hypothetical protein